ncbi:MAG: HlyC/CorC family transporter [Clostridia bacterium]|nr:HlyC/CorC family transporter [Clostridia bacterium]
MTLDFILIGICLLFSAFFSSAEIAYNMSSESRLEKKAEEEGRFFQRLAFKIKDNYNFTITAILIGNNISNNILTVIATSLVIRLFANLSDNVAATLTTLVVTLVLLIFGELGPKSIASSRGESIAYAFAIPLYIIMIILSPVAWIATLIVKLVSRPFKDSETPTVTTDELASIIETGEEEGGIGEEMSELLQSAIDFNDTSVKEIMIPRVDMIAVDIEDGIDGVLEAAAEHNFSRIPVYENTIDNIIGILVIQKLYRKLIDTDKSEIDLRSLLVEPYFIHMTVKLDDALDVLREERTHLMVVLDEFGGTAGIVSMEDILEELVGEIWDEDEEAEREIEEISDDTYTVEGDMNIFDFFDAIDVNVLDFESEYTTVGGWAIEMLDGFPEVDASFDFRNITVTIKSIEDHRITKLSAVVREDLEDDEEDED